MSPSFRSTKMATSIGPVVSKVFRALDPSSSNQSPDPACEDGRKYDWPSLRELSALVRSNYEHLCSSKAQREQAALVYDEETLESYVEQVKEDRRIYRGSLDTLNKRLIAAPIFAFLPRLISRHRTYPQLASPIWEKRRTI